MPEFVCYTQPHDPEMMRRFVERLDPTKWQVQTQGPDANTTILITGYASEQELRSSPNLRAVIIPFAGIPPRTRDLFLAYPHLAVHNLHHNAPETAETAMALMLACAKHLIPMDQALRSGDWSPRYDPSLAIRLEGKTAVIVGYGAVGQRIAQACLGMGMKVIAHRRRSTLVSTDSGEVEARGPDLLQHSLSEADVLFLAVPQTTETAGMLGAPELALMKPNAILVNVARAGLVDEGALFEALRDKRIRAAGLDVWYRYPENDAAKGYMGYVAISDSVKATTPSNLPFHELDNVVMSPHRGGTSADVEAARVDALCELLSSEPMVNRVDVTAGY